MSNGAAHYPQFSPANEYETSYPPLQHEIHGDVEGKAQFDDDLIDSYGQAQPQTFHINTQTTDPLGGRQSWRSPYPPLSHSQSYSTATLGGTETDFSLNDGSRGLDEPPAFEAKEKKGPTGIWAKILPDSIPCRLYVLTVFIETIIDLAIETDILLRFGDQDGIVNLRARRLPVYLSIFAFAHVFQLIMALNAVYGRNTLQFIFLTLFNLLFLVYSVIQIVELRDAILEDNGAGISAVPVKVLTAIIPIVISVAEVAYIALGYKIWLDFGWKVYKQLGADRRIKRMFAQYQIFLCLIKFDVFFFIGFSVQLIWLVLQKNNWEYYVTCAALPMSFVLLVVGHLAARREHKIVMGAFLVGLGGAMIYFVYKLIKVVKLRNTTEFIAVWKSLSVFAVLAIIFLFATIAFAWIVMRNFGAGLKHQLNKAAQNARERHNRRGTEQQVRHSTYPMSTNPTKRLSID